VTQVRSEATQFALAATNQKEVDGVATICGVSVILFPSYTHFTANVLAYSPA